MAPRGTLLDEEWVDRLEALGVDEIKVRSPITCNNRYGVCAACYGRDLARGHMVNAGEAIGAVGISGDTSEKDEYCAVLGICATGHGAEPPEPDPEWRESSLHGPSDAQR